MMIRGLLAAVKTERASAMALESAALKGGGGQQDTSLWHKHTLWKRQHTPTMTNQLAHTKK